MKVNGRKAFQFFLVMLILVFGSWNCLFAGNPESSNKEHESITKKLIGIVDQNAELKQLLVKSIEKARKVNEDPATNPVQTLEQYYDFIDWASKALPWELLPKLPYSMLYDRIDQGLAFFYFINDQPLEELSGKGYFHNTIQYYEPYQTWLMSFVKDWGLFLSTAASWNNEFYKKALEDPRFGLGKGWYENPQNWKSFNDFFSRRLASPGMRPFASHDDPSVVCSPGDSKPYGIWKIDRNSNIADGKSVQVKSKSYHSVGAILGPDCAFHNAFAEGTMTFAYLDEYDYHRCHFPVSGTIREARIIKGGASSGGITSWDAKSGKYVFDPGMPGWQSLETRGCIVVETENAGLVALIPVGMSQMGSVNFEDNVKPGSKVKKGDKLCYFLFGGSGFVMLFQKEAAFRITAPASGEGSYLHMLAGEEFGRTARIK